MIKRILITGCTQGLGYALAVEFAEKGCQVFAVGRHSQQLERLVSHSLNIRTINADITTNDGRRKIIEAVGNEPLSIIHNAAIIKPEKFINLSEYSFRLQLETNYCAPLLLTQKLLFALKGQRVLHISSGAAAIALSGLLTYCATKTALEHTSRCLNTELNSEEIYFAHLRPGMMDTSMQFHLRNADENDLPNRQFYVDAKQKNQLISPEKVARFVALVMLKTDNKTFSNSVWDIENHRHQELEGYS